MSLTTLLRLLPALGLAAPMAAANPNVPAATEGTAMTDPHAAATRALALDVASREGMLEVRLIGRSAHAQVVSYTLEVTGNSTSRHEGRTTLTAGTQAVLSTMRTQAGENWCVTLVAEEEGGAPYTISRGPCDKP
jgi:hypothetical protein